MRTPGVSTPSDIRAEKARQEKVTQRLATEDSEDQQRLSLNSSQDSEASVDNPIFDTEAPKQPKPKPRPLSSRSRSLSDVAHKVYDQKLKQKQEPAPYSEKNMVISQEDIKFGFS